MSDEQKVNAIVEKHMNTKVCFQYHLLYVHFSIHIVFLNRTSGYF